MNIRTLTLRAATTTFSAALAVAAVGCDLPENACHATTDEAAAICNGKADSALEHDDDQDDQDQDDQDQDDQDQDDQDQDDDVPAWTIEGAKEAFDDGDLPTLAEVAGTWKVAAWGHNKSKHLELAPTGIPADEGTGYQETFAFIATPDACPDTLHLTMVQTWGGTEGTMTELSLGSGFEADDAIPEVLPFGPREKTECRRLEATDDMPEQLICWERGISSGSILWRCMVREDSFDKRACQF